MDAMQYLQRNTWSLVDMADFELDALVDILGRVTVTTEAERFIRDRIIDGQIRRENHKAQFPELWEGYVAA